jgi:hypothetical protein
MRRGAGVMLGSNDTTSIPDRIPERIYFAGCRVPGSHGFGLVALLAADMGHDFQPVTACGDPRRCSDKVGHPPECAA